MIHNPYMKAIIIVHGKSEKTLCEYIKSNLRLNIHIASEKKGQCSIQITSLKSFLNRIEYKSLKDFLREFKDELPENIKKLPENFKIFTIMDTDDCTDEQKKNYIDKTMFKKHWAYEYIHPIYNIENLEDVMRKSGVNITSKKDYIKIFPINNNGDAKDTEQIEKLLSELKKNKKITNIHEFFEFCLDLTK